MHQNRYIGIFLLVISLCFVTSFAQAQLGFSFDIPKPKQYEDRQLPSEKSEQKKFTVPRHFLQNTVTHYNYFFDANNKLNEVIERAKASHRDDYTQLLSFYNYDLDATAADSVQLDSVIYKSTSGIVLHDLRNDWADNLYLLWGAAHYLQKEFDSAYLTFQFINYAFAPKEKDGYYQYIGSNMDGNSALSISTKEKRSLTKKVFSRPPSRNEAFIWQIRNFLAWEQYPEAASLIVTLKSDPAFPARLHNDLEEVQALYFYKQSQWDSCAAHLTNALGNATNNQERARWEFLIAQLNEKTGHNDLSQRYYERAAGHTVDPVMAVYARLYSIRVDKSGGDHFIEQNISELLKMAKRDRFEDYRDIIYYMAAEMEIQRNNIDGARQLLIKAAKYNSGNISQRNKAYMKLADLAFASKEYRQASNFYDSLVLSDPSLKDVDAITKRKEILGHLAAQSDILYRQDSLQRVAAMPEAQRKDFVKKILKEFRRQAGLKEGETALTGGSGVAPVTDIFGSSQSAKGDWYFYNDVLKQRGLAEFKTRWGNRPNVDNWRRIQAVTNQVTSRPSNNAPSTNNDNFQKANETEELTFEALYDKLPITDDQKKVSNDSIANALFEIGKIYAEDLEDCGSVISTYGRLQKDYPEFGKMDEVLFRLYYCYHKNGENGKAAEVSAELAKQYPGSNLASIITTGKSADADQKLRATQTYEKIYDLFIEGSFDQALAEKKAADSLYGENYWSPQLLYIQAVYYIKQRTDSTAIDVLKSLQTKYPSSPLAARAGTMIDVLGRRKQIEDELSNLKIERPQPEARRKPALDNNDLQPDTILAKPMIAKTDTASVRKPISTSVRNDSITKKNATTITSFAFNASTPHYVMIILNKVDVVFGNEAKNAFARFNSENYYNKTFELNTIPLDDEHKLLLIRPFENAQAAIDYINALKPRAASEIVPWLKADKYSFSIITDQNLEVLKVKPDLAAYKMFLDQNLPGKF